MQGEATHRTQVHIKQTCPGSRREGVSLSSSLSHTHIHVLSLTPFLSLAAFHSTFHFLHLKQKILRIKHFKNPNINSFVLSLSRCVSPLTRGQTHTRTHVHSYVHAYIHTYINTFTFTHSHKNTCKLSVTHVTHPLTYTLFRHYIH